MYIHISKFDAFLNIKQIHFLRKITFSRSFVFAANELLLCIQRLLLATAASGQPERVWRTGAVVGEGSCGEGSKSLLVLMCML